MLLAVQQSSAFVQDQVSILFVDGSVPFVKDHQAGERKGRSRRCRHHRWTPYRRRKLEQEQRSAYPTKPKPRASVILLDHSTRRLGYSYLKGCLVHDDSEPELRASPCSSNAMLTAKTENAKRKRNIKQAFSVYLFTLNVFFNTEEEISINISCLLVPSVRTLRCTSLCQQFLHHRAGLARSLPIA